jgi:hypothetical protein
MANDPTLGAAEIEAAPQPYLFTALVKRCARGDTLRVMDIDLLRRLAPAYEALHATIASLTAERDEAIGNAQHALHQAEQLAARNKVLQDACSRQNDEVCQTLGKALGYPWFKDDPTNFPGATEADGVCVGDAVADDLAQQAAERIASLTARAEAAEATNLQLLEQDKRSAILVREMADGVEARLADETAIVDRIWKLLGSPTYEELAGRSIYDLIKEKIDTATQAALDPEKTP